MAWESLQRSSAGEKKKDVTCSDVTTAAWTGSLRHTFHPAAGDAGCCLARRRCKPGARTPVSRDRTSHYHQSSDKNASEILAHVWPVDQLETSGSSFIFYFSVTYCWSVIKSWTNWRVHETETDKILHSMPLLRVHWAYLQGSHADDLIGVIEEIGQNIKNGRFREDEFLCQETKHKNMY